jgi:hypothetical protein
MLVRDIPTSDNGDPERSVPGANPAARHPAIMP